MGNTIRPVGSPYNSNNNYRRSTGAQLQGPYVKILLEQKLAALHRQVKDIRQNKSSNDLSAQTLIGTKEDQMSTIRKLLEMEAGGIQPQKFI